MKRMCTYYLAICAQDCIRISQLNLIPVESWSLAPAHIYHLWQKKVDQIRETEEFAIEIEVKTVDVGTRNLAQRG